MKKPIAYFLFLALSVSLLAFVNNKEENSKGFNSSFADVLQHAKEYTLEVAESMPAEDYTFKPTDSVRSFGEQLAHIAMSTKMINDVFIKGEEFSFDPVESGKTEKMTGASKEACIKMINANFDEVIAHLKSMSDGDLEEKFVFSFAPNKPEFTKEQGFLFLRDHITHHRAQAITALRMKGHKAPPYRAF